jgi:large subunit ribosomal protein L3
MLLSKGILGRKLGMTQLLDEAGKAVGVTVLQAGPCVVVQRKAASNDGYSAVQLGFEQMRAKVAGKPRVGHCQKAGVGPMRRLAEFRLADADSMEPGHEITVGIFEPGEHVSVSALSKGRGFAGVMKRHGFHGGPASHGSMLHRKPASGGATTPAHTVRGTKKPGRMGGKRFTTKGLAIVRVDAERNLLLVKGAVPGAPGGLVRITQPIVPPRKSHKVKIVS